jgi:hypothetical protein
MHQAASVERSAFKGDNVTDLELAKQELDRALENLSLQTAAIKTAKLHHENAVRLWTEAEKKYTRLRIEAQLKVR